MARNQGEPHYRRIMAALLTRCNQPALKGERLLSERALAARFHVARNTAARALRELCERGYLHRRRGAGTFRARAICPAILAWGYHVSRPPFNVLFECLQYALAREGYSLAIRDFGVDGGKMPDLIRDPILPRARAIFWLAPSYPAALAAAAEQCQKLPAELPLVLVNDLMGVELHGRQRVDLVHFDYAEAARQLVGHLAAAGCRHPLLIRRTYLDARYASEQIRVGWTAALAERGLPDAEAHVVNWNPETPGGLGALLYPPPAARGWQPDAILLPWAFNAAFLRHCRAQGNPIPKTMPVIGFGQNKGRFRLPMNYRRLAEMCAELLVSRLRQPARGNWHALVPLPVITSRTGAAQ